MKKELVVIGNGMAGAAAIEEIIKFSPERYNITVFGKEKHTNYNRVLLTDVLSGKKTLKDITLNTPEWYKERGIKLLTGCGIEKINRAKRTVIAKDGTETKYDKLVLATGSTAIMPPIKGAEKGGVFSFRDVEDCEKITAALDDCKRAVVIGGGLIGLEVAKGLLSMGKHVTVVHLMNRLMERQLDAIAAAYLKEDLEKAGMEILLEKEALEFTGEDKINGIRFKDGSTIECGMAVVAVGIKPNMELAKNSGIYCEKGIVVSDTMQTYDPSVYAVGECVQHRGATFGLVVQVFEQARVLANHLAADSRLMFKNSPVSVKLKVSGIELYSAGDVQAKDNADAIEYADKGGRIYKKLFIEDKKLKGMVLYGDTADGGRLFQYLVEGADISERRKTLLFGDVIASRHIADMPDNAIVCGCNGVTKKTIVEAIEKKGLFTKEDVSRETKAGTGCGGCGSIVEGILESILGSSFRSKKSSEGICECTKYSREDVIKNIREKNLRSVAEVMETLGWETVGCEKCRPALNYYVSMINPAGFNDDPTSRLVNERAKANIQKDGMFSVVPRMYGGVTTASDLKRIAEVAEKYNVALVKLTGGQRIDLLGVKKDDLPSVWKDLDMTSGHAYAKALRTVKTCVGAKFCRYGTQDSLGLGIEIEKRFEGLTAPAKIKIGVSGCPRNCAEFSIKDVGVLGIQGGYEIYVGGCGGIKLKSAELLAPVTSSEEVIEIIGAFLQHYREEAEYGERTYAWAQRVGIETIKNAVVVDKKKRERLFKSLSEALRATEDPWKEKNKNEIALPN
ncbi:MAG TPA: nitrite reductase large subunit NirB [Thermodesulfobacteriota bacterium]|nr:nitrite reductase large subunit NirB [Thermodesulfobacteriota bacterium]